MAVLAGLATLFHVFVGGWGSVALGLTVLTSRVGTWRDRFIAIGLWVAACSYVLIIALGSVLEKVRPLVPDPNWIYVFFRNPHHFLPWQFDIDADQVIFAVVAGWILLHVGKYWQGSPMAKTVAQVALWTLLPYGLGLVASLNEHGMAFLKLYPFRVGSCLFLLFGTILTVPVLSRVQKLWTWLPSSSVLESALCWAASERLAGATGSRVLRTVFSPVGSRLLLTGVALLAFSDAGADFYGGLDDLKRFPMGGKVRSSVRSSRLHRACNWIKKSTPRDALILAPITQGAISYLAERPVVVTFRQVPSAPADVHEWYTRLLAFNRRRIPIRTGYRAGREIQANFDRMSDSEFRRLASRYGASYLLFRQRRKLSLPLRYENADWAVYDLRSEPAGGSEGRSGASDSVVTVQQAQGVAR